MFTLDIPQTSRKHPAGLGLYPTPPTVDLALDAPAHFATVEIGLVRAHRKHKLSTSPYVARTHHAGCPPESL